MHIARQYASIPDSAEQKTFCSASRQAVGEWRPVKIPQFVMPLGSQSLHTKVKPGVGYEVPFFSRVQTLPVVPYYFHGTRYRYSSGC